MSDSGKNSDIEVTAVVDQKTGPETNVQKDEITKESIALAVPLENTNVDRIVLEPSADKEEVTEKIEAPQDNIGQIMEALDKDEKLDHYSSDECEVDSDSSDADSSSENSSSSEESSSESDSDEESELEDVELKGDIDEADEDDESGGPIRSKNEIIDEKAYRLPEGFTIDEKAPLELIGEVISAVEKSVIIKAFVSGEFRILKENSVLCLEDRTPIGPLFEVFGRLQSPFYRVKFDSDSELAEFKDKIGAKVFYVVPESLFLYTDEIKAIKGTDASNWNDEEVPEEEQEFSDDEKEAMSKKKKKKSKSKNESTNNVNKRRLPNDDSGRKVAQYKPLYANYKSVNESVATPVAEEPPKPVTKVEVDPQDQMRKLQEQFLQIHNQNTSRTTTNKPASVPQHRSGQFVPPPNMQRNVQPGPFQPPPHNHLPHNYQQPMSIPFNNGYQQQQQPYYQQPQQSQQPQFNYPPANYPVPQQPPNLSQNHFAPMAYPHQQNPYPQPGQQPPYQYGAPGPMQQDPYAAGQRTQNRNKKESTNDEEYDY